MKQERSIRHRHGVLLAYFLGRPVQFYLERFTRDGSTPRSKLS